MEIESALRITLDPQTTRELREQASGYCETFQASPDAWKFCLATYTNTSQEEFKFFCHKVVLDFISTSNSATAYYTLSIAEKMHLKSVVWSWLTSHIAPNTMHLSYHSLSNLLLLIVRIYRLESTISGNDGWPGFFPELVALIRVANDAKSNNNDIKGYSTAGVNVFLRVCFVLHDEFVCHMIQRTVAEQKLNVLVKDVMRVSAIPLLFSTWLELIQTTNTELIRKCFSLVGLYVSWSDINLVVTPDYLSVLYGCLGMEQCSEDAFACIGEIVLKGMLPNDKIKLLNVINLSQILSLSVSAPITLSKAKFVNTVGFEMCCCYTNATIDTEKAQCFAILISVYENAGLILGFETGVQSDQEICAALLPFISAYLLILKKNVRTRTGMSLTNINLSMLLQVLVKRSTYSEDEPYQPSSTTSPLNSIAGVPETELDADLNNDFSFLEFRATIKSCMESIVAISEDIYESYILKFVTYIFSQIKSSKPDEFRWPNAELPLYLLYIYVEAKTVKAMNSGTVEPFKNSSPYEDAAGKTNLSLMITKMIESGISSHSHKAVTFTYFECVIRYSTFLEHEEIFILPVLQSFLDERGLHHRVAKTRYRLNYLFSKFVKILRAKLAVYAQDIIFAINDLLVIPQRQINDHGLPTDNSYMEGTVHLFDSVGMIASVESLDPTRQLQLLQSVSMPLLQKIQDILVWSSESNFQELNPILVWQLHDNICALGSLGKGYPDYNPKSKLPQAWAECWNEVLAGILTVLTKYHTYPLIRSACRQALSRLAGTMGPQLFSYIPTFFSSGLLTDTTKEMTEFLIFLNLILFKMQALNIGEVMADLWPHLSVKLTQFLETSPVGTDDCTELIALRKQTLSFILALFNTNLAGVLTHQNNLHNLPTLLAQCLGCLDEPSDSHTRRLLFSLLGKMIGCWCSPETALPGFIDFVKTTIIPVLFISPLKFTGEGTSSVFQELATLHFTCASSIPGYVAYIVGEYLPSISFPKEEIDMFAKCADLNTGNPKALRNHLIVHDY